jgi:hypothetical protein
MDKLLTLPNIKFKKCYFPVHGGEEYGARQYDWAHFLRKSFVNLLQFAGMETEI